MVDFISSLIFKRSEGRKGLDIMTDFLFFLCIKHCQNIIAFYFYSN